MKKLYIFFIFLSGCLGVEGEGLFERFQGISEIVHKSPYTVTLYWTAVKNVEKYEIYLSTSDVPIAITTSNEYELTDLEPSRQYIFAVNAVYFDGREEGISVEKNISMWDEFTGVTSASSSKSSEAIISWVYEHTDVSYLVYMGENDVDYTKEVKTTTSNTVTITGLKGDTLYKFAVYAKYADSKLDTNTKTVELRTVSAIDPLPTISIDAVTMGATPNVEVKGGKTTYRTDLYNKNNVNIGNRTGAGKVATIASLILEEGINEFYAIVSDGLGNSTRIENINTVVKKLNLDTPSLVPYYNGLSTPFVSIRNSSVVESGANEISTVSTAGFPNPKNSQAGDFNCDGYMDLVVGVPSGSSDAETYCVDTTYHNTVGCQRRAFGYILIYYGTANGLEGVSPIIYNFQNEAEGSLDYYYNGGWGYNIVVGNFNGDTHNGKACEDVAVSSDIHNSRGGFAVFYGSSTGLFLNTQVKQLHNLASNNTHCDANTCNRAFFVPPINLAPSGLTESNNNRFGASLASGDLNNDGYTDLAVGMYRVSSTDFQRVYIFLGSVEGLGIISGYTKYIVLENFDNKTTIKNFGSNLTIADLDNDGYSDLLVSSYELGTLNAVPNIWQGKIYYIKGTVFSELSLISNENYYELSTFLSNYAPRIKTISIHPRSNKSGSNAPSFSFLENAGDINGDSYTDLIASSVDDHGIPSDGSLKYYAGAIYAIYGGAFGPQIGTSSESDYVSGTGVACSAGLCKIQRIASPFRTAICPNVPNSYCFFGSSISSYDLDQDTFSDVLVSFPTKNKDASNYLSGELDIYYGSATGLKLIPSKLRPSTAKAGDMFGYSSVVSKFRGASSPPDLFVTAYHKDKILEASPEELTPEAYVFRQNFNGLGGIDDFSSSDLRAPSFNLKINYSKFESMYFDNVVFNAGDINGDGYDDVLMKGSSYYPESTGTRNSFVIIYYGSKIGIISELNSGCVSPSIQFEKDTNDYICPQILSSKYIYEELQGSVNDYFFQTVNGGGDVNGDSYADIFSTSASGSFIFYGSSSGPIISSPPLMDPISSLDPKIINTGSSGNINNYYFYKAMETSVAGGTYYLNGYTQSNGLAWQNTYGDFNGDGYSDLVFMSYVSYTGGPIIVYGSSSGIQSDGGLSYYNASTNPEGDVLMSNQIGTTDYPKQCQGDIPYLQCKAIKINPGATTAPASEECSAGYKNVATGCGTYAYVATVRNLGDINRDGYEDLAVIASYSTNYGDKARSFIYYGSKEGLLVNGRVHPENSEIRSPQIIQFSDIAGRYGIKFLTGYAGDINGDGFNDYVIGASYSSSNFYVFYGSLNGLKITNALTLDSHFVTGVSCENGEPEGPNMPDNSCVQLKVAQISLAEHGVSYAGHSGTMSIGDLNADGYSDILQTYNQFYKSNAGSIPETGAVVIYFGSKYGLRVFKQLGSSQLAVLKTTPDCLISEGLGCTPMLIMPDIPYLQLTKMSYFLSGDYNGDGTSDLLLGSKNIFYHKRLSKAYMETYLNPQDIRLDYLPSSTSTGHMWYIYK